MVIWGSMAKGAERWLWTEWADGLVMKEKTDVIFLLFLQIFTCLDSCRHHKQGKLISNDFSRGGVGEGGNLAQIVILRGTSQKAYPRERQKRVWICWPQSGLWIEAWGSKSADGVRIWTRERKLGLGSTIRNFLSKGKWMKKLPTNPLITLWHGLKSYTAQYLAWCPLQVKVSRMLHWMPEECLY